MEYLITQSEIEKAPRWKVNFISHRSYKLYRQKRDTMTPAECYKTVVDLTK